MLSRPCRRAAFDMLFVFILDTNVGMTQTFLSAPGAEPIGNFTPTALDAAMYYIEYYSKV